MGLTAAEYEHLLGQLLAEARDRSAGNPAAFPLRYLIVSMDNAKPHARWLRNTPAERKNEIPPRSPDIHKAVEHPLKAFNDRWYVAFTKDLRCTSCTAAMALAAEVLHRTTADSIWRDIQTLPATFKSIIRNKGDWADDELC